MTTTLLVLATLAALVAAGFLKFRSLPTKRKKKLIKKSVASFYQRIEDWGLVPRTPGFVADYHRMYPGLEALEKNHELVKRECLDLLSRSGDLTDMRDMGGSYTQAGIHTAQWKTFMFKSGSFIEENCALAPETAQILRDIPDLYTAFFSVLAPHQYITPHWGYYKGFLRYHLGVIIPGDNAEQSCWLRVNDDRDDNLAKDRDRITRGVRYWWHEGEGVVFDDTYLHDAANESDQVRVVLWIDMLKPHPWYLQIVNRLFLWFAHRDRSVQKIRENALVTAPEPGERSGS